MRWVRRGGRRHSVGGRERLTEEYEYRAEDKRRAWLALCDDEEAPLPDPPARKVAGYERMAAAIRGLAKETEEE